MKTLQWIGDVNGYLDIIDQRQLPAKLVRLKITNVKGLFGAIKTLAIRGAPAIGVAAGYGMVLATQNLDARLPSEASAEQKAEGGCSILDAFEGLKKTADYLASSRPTAVNLFWAMDRIKQAAKEFISKNPKSDLQSLKEQVLTEANAIYAEDVDMCRRIGENGAKFIKDNSGILTHCNAGSLATAGEGTALSVLYEAHRKGKKFKVYADETRPLLQGSRLTAWELKQAGIDVTVICDNMAGSLMKQGLIGTVITGADRIAANGDTANKIGTYSLSVLAKAHNISFYIAAPSSTFDLSIKDGSEIPIEQRAADEVTTFAGVKTAPDDVTACNPAFDITPAQNITAIITERGVIEGPTQEKIAEHLR